MMYECIEAQDEDFWRTRQRLPCIYFLPHKVNANAAGMAVSGTSSVGPPVEVSLSASRAILLAIINCF